MITKSVVAAVVGAAAILVNAVPVEAAPAGAAPTVRTVVTGLDNPRGIAFGPHGELYVAEAGRGGAGPCRTGPQGGQVCAGRSGAITAVTPAGRSGRITPAGRWRIQAGLPSLASARGTEASGPSDVTVGSDGRLYYTIGRGGEEAAGLYRAGRHPAMIADLGRADLGRTDLGRADPGRADLGRADLGRADLGRKGPVALLAADRGHLILDAGANALVRVGPRGRLSTVAAFPAAEAIRSVAQGPDGAYYAGGRARIWRVVPGEAPTVYASGLTDVTDLAWTPDGRLYVLESGGLENGHDGALLRVDRKGAHRVVASAGLTVPGGLAIRDGYAYISNCSVCAGTGSVVRLRLGS